MAEQAEGLFRKKTLERISSPEQLTDYLKVTSPGVWLIMISVIALLAGLLAWASIGTLETRSDARVIVNDDVATVVLVDGSLLAQGMPLYISEQEYVIASVTEDEYGRPVGLSGINLPDGTYQGQVVTESVHPIDFFIKSGQ